MTLGAVLYNSSDKIQSPNRLNDQHGFHENKLQGFHENDLQGYHKNDVQGFDQTFQNRVKTIAEMLLPLGNCTWVDFAEQV